MSSQNPTGKPPPAPSSTSSSTSNKLPVQPLSGSAGGGYVNRYKLQQQRIRALNQMEENSEAHKRLQKSLPKIQAGPGPEKENLVIRAVQRSNTIASMKLPGVRRDIAPQRPSHVTTHKRKSLPVKTYHLRVNPDHTSFISKSLPSLPSIPGSPSYPEDKAVSPITERVTDKEKAKVPLFMGKHRYEKIVFQKHLHRESTDWLKNDAATDTKSNTSTTSATAQPGHPRVPALPGGTQGTGTTQQVKPHTSGSVRIRYSRLPKEADVSETQSEPGFEVMRKWKENCRCLRCQMLQRQFREGDTLYDMWGRYPCHHIDPSILLDDD